MDLKKGPNRAINSTNNNSFSTFLISSIVTIKILWSHFFANKIKGIAYILQILRGFIITFLYSLLRLIIVALLYWLKVCGKGNLYYIKFK